MGGDTIPMGDMPVVDLEVWFVQGFHMEAEGNLYVIQDAGDTTRVPI